MYKINHIDNSGSILYISYTGLMEPLGQSQIFNYLRYLAKDYNIILVTYEKYNDLKDHIRLEKTKYITRKAKIDWRPLHYHKNLSLFATAYDLLIGFLFCGWIIIIKKVSIIHARSYVPSLLALVFKKIFGVNYIFDMRGFWVDERVAGTVWKSNSYFYKIGKWFEQQFLKNADIIISLSNAAIEEIKKFPYLKNRTLKYKVIPTCTDLSHFKPHYLDKNLFTALNLVDKFVVGYVGSVGGWQLFDEVLDCFKIVKNIKPNAFFIILNKGQHDFILRQLDKHGFCKNDFALFEVYHEEVPKYINLCQIGIFFNKPGFARKASAPTRLGEFLACGVPVITNDGIGDVESIIMDNQVGVIIRNFNEDEYKVAVQDMLNLLKTEKIKVRCREKAERIFSLEQGVRNYSSVYRRLLVQQKKNRRAKQ